MVCHENLDPVQRKLHQCQFVIIFQYWKLGKFMNMPLFAGFRVFQLCASVSQLPAALRQPQKNTPLDLGNMYFVDFLIFE